MRRTTLVVVISLFLVPLGFSQAYPVAEFSTSFTVLNNEYGTDRQNSPGVEFGFGYNLLRNLRLVADFGAETHSKRIVWTNGRSADADGYQILIGPELTIRNSEKVTCF